MLSPSPCCSWLRHEPVTLQRGRVTGSCPIKWTLSGGLEMKRQRWQQTEAVGTKQGRLREAGLLMAGRAERWWLSPSDAAVPGPGRQ